MGHPTLEEFCRAHEFRPDFLRRCQREFRDINAQLDERAHLLTENAALRDVNAVLREQLAERPTSIKEKRPHAEEIHR